MNDQNWMHFDYEDLETEAVKEREENEKFDAECAREEEEASRKVGESERARHEPFEPTPTKAQRVKKDAKLILECMREDGISTYNDRVIYQLVIALAEAIDER